MDVIVSLTSDLGNSEYVAAMKGVILSLNPDARIVDVKHDIQPQNVRQGALIMSYALPYLPEGVHLGVVDPGVGTGRKSIIIECERGFLVGPDNGLLIPAAKELGMKGVFEISEREVSAGEVSPTFHGRDIFAPAAARLSLGERAEELGKKVEEWMDIDFGRFSARGGRIRGEILYADRFGNLISNIPYSKVKDILPLGSRVFLDLAGKEIPFTRTYAEAKPDDLICLISSMGYLEIAVNRGSAKKQLSVKEGQEVEISKVDEK